MEQCTHELIQIPLPETDGLSKGIKKPYIQ